MITSRQNRLAKDIRRLRRSKGDTALLEGPHLIREGLEAGLGLQHVLVTPGFLEGAEWRRLEAGLPIPPTLIDAGLLEELTDADSPRGVVAVARLPRAGIESLPLREGAVYLHAETVQDPGNLGALARVAEASGCAGLALGPGSAHPNHPRALRASAGSLLRLPLAVGVSVEDLEAHLAALRPVWVALVPRGGEDLYDADLADSLVVLLGAEGPGLSRSLTLRAERRVSIPLAAPVESLNATVAAGIFLFELRRRRLARRPS